MIAKGYCQCGCGEPTKVSQVNNRYFGYVRGEPLTYVHGHGSRSNPPFWIVDPATGCWQWQHSKNRDGYGQITFDRKHLLPHRLTYASVHGEIPEGLMACHSCDNPACVNPDHIFLGTHDDNMADRLAKGRYATGQDNPTAKLTDEIVREIRRRVDSGEKRISVARHLDLHHSTVGRVVAREIWAHIE